MFLLKLLRIEPIRIDNRRKQHTNKNVESSFLKFAPAIRDQGCVRIINLFRIGAKCSNQSIKFISPICRDEQLTKAIQRLIFSTSDHFRQLAFVV